MFLFFFWVILLLSEMQQTVELERFSGDLNTQFSFSPAYSKAEDELLTEQKAQMAISGWMKLEVKANDRNAHVGAENGGSSEFLMVKENLAEDLNDHKILLSRLDFYENLNACLEYEVRDLRKELSIRNAEIEFHLKSAEALQKQHLESVRKISRLETESERLRVVLRKWMTDPRTLTKMRTAIEMQGSGYELNPQRESHGVPILQKLSPVEEENKILKEALAKKNRELQSSWAMIARTTSKLSHLETQFEELSRVGTSHVPCDTPNHYNEDNKSCSESWASALISELEHFRNGNPTASSSRTIGSLELNSLDDFLEMEKVTIVCNNGSTLENDYSLSNKLNKETECYVTSKVIPSSCHDFEQCPSQLQDIMKIVAQKQQLAHRSASSILEEVKAGLDSEENSSANISAEIHDIHSDSKELDVFSPSVSNSKNTNCLSQSCGMNSGLVEESRSLKIEETRKDSECVGCDRAVKVKSLDEKDEEHIEVGKDKEELSGLCLKRVTTREKLTEKEKDGEKGFRTKWEIFGVSEKLAQCQETITTLGKQLKALDSPRKESIFDKISISPQNPNHSTIQHHKLLEPPRTVIDHNADEIKVPERSGRRLIAQPGCHATTKLKNPNIGMYSKAFGEEAVKEKSLVALALASKKKKKGRLTSVCRLLPRWGKKEEVKKVVLPIMC